MKNWKRPLTESLLVGTAIALAIIFVTRRQIFAILDVISQVFYVPFHGAALLSGNASEPPPWLFHSVLTLQCIVAVFALGWVAGRYRTQRAKG